MYFHRDPWASLTVPNLHCSHAIAPGTWRKRTTWQWAQWHVSGSCKSRNNLHTRIISKLLGWLSWWTDSLGFQLGAFCCFPNAASKQPLLRRWASNGSCGWNLEPPGLNKLSHPVPCWAYYEKWHAEGILRFEACEHEIFLRRSSWQNKVQQRQLSELLPSQTLSFTHSECRANL